jgi:succinate dehydrogenase / fumarate reductase flavoprotein subunit
MCAADMSGRIVVVGAGLAGLFAALTAAENGANAALVSIRPSERAQSVMAEGGINAALGDDDSARNHYDDTMEAGRFIADPNAVKGLIEAAPGIVRRLLELGVLFNMRRDDMPELRYFGGQKIKRAVFAQSGTGKQIMSAVIQEARKYEARGLITRYDRHVFAGLLRDGKGCTGCAARDVYSGAAATLNGGVIIATGGMHGLFGGTTGSLDNSGAATATLFKMGLPLSNAEFIQYHPTTAGIPGKRLLISEAARGEGGRLYVSRNGKPYYFMEDKFPEMGNLAPRDVISREMWSLDEQAYLDLSGLSSAIWNTRLANTLDDCLTHLRLDPRKDPIPVAPGVHYFMGGIQVDEAHRTVLPNLYAAGECCCQYHGASRLGGNSLLGAIYGGITAARSALADGSPIGGGEYFPADAEQSARDRLKTQTAARNALGIARDRAGLETGIAELEKLPGSIPLLARAMAIGALERRESRGAHLRTDYPEPNDAVFQKTTVAVYRGGKISVRFEDTPKKR